MHRREERSGVAGSAGHDRTRAAEDEAGFSLIETVIAITIAAMIFTSSAFMLGQALKGTLLARQNEQAAEVLTAQIEAIRALDYAAIAMVPADLVGNPAITGPPQKVDHDGPSGPLAAELIPLSATGAINPHRSTVTRNSTVYAVTRYVSEVSDAVVTSARVKRVTVMARWESSGRQHERVSSTLITRTRRGLPLPEFSFGVKVTKNVAPGGEIVFPVTLHNRGARDRWNLSVTAPAALPGAWIWYRDSSQPSSLTSGGPNGDYDDGIDIRLPYTVGDPSSRQDTGLIDVDQPISYLVKYSGTAPGSAGTTYAITLTAQSAAQPSAAGGIANLVDTVNVVSAASATCPTCVEQTYALHNDLGSCTLPCDTKAQDPLPLDQAAPVRTQLGDFDTDLDTEVGALRGGRRLSEGGAGASETNKARMVRWSRQMGTPTTVADVAKLRLHVATLEDGADNTVSITVFVVHRPQGSGTDAILGQVTTNIPGGTPDAFQLVGVDVPLAGTTTLGGNDRLEIRVILNPGDATSDSLRIAYGTTAETGTFSYSVLP